MAHKKISLKGIDNAETFVKVQIGKNKQWLKYTDTAICPFIKTGRIDAISVKTGKKVSFSPDNVIAFYKGNIKEIESLGMPYIPAADVCTILDTIVPDSMGYETHIAARIVEIKVGKRLNEYVAEKLNYTELELCKALSAEQVDAVAMAIYNIEEKKQGMIIGDQTGIGKGRVAAAMIRYGVLTGHKPIFITEKPNLFSDIYRDLIDIGSDEGMPKYQVSEAPTRKKINYKPWEELSDSERDDWSDNVEYNDYINDPENQYEEVYKRVANPKYNLTSGKRVVPFILNGKEAKTAIIDKKGNIIYEGTEKAELASILKSRKLPAPYSCVLMTYSQVNSARQLEKRNFFTSVAKNNIIIMDESHNASGTSQTGEYLQSVLVETKGVVFLSATFAKRPDNMPIYAMKTAMKDCNMNKEELVDAIKRGGVALQEVISSQLVSEGQMLRRERSFEGVEVNYITLTEKEIEHKAIFDNITSILRDIIDFQTNYVSEIVKKMDKIAAAEGKEATERKGTSKAGVDNQPYFSKVFQVINQILFSLKAKSVAEIAIERLQEGKKPVIAFASTMETFLDELGSAGDTIDLDFRSVLNKGLDGVMRYTVKDEAGNAQYKTFGPDELGPEAFEKYTEILAKIHKIAVGISISPIDIIKTTIRNAGYTCEEVTGRKYEVQLLKNNESRGVLLNRKKVLANEAFLAFQNNELDCLMINQSGSTGASAHAIVTDKVKANDVKQRVMIILQAELDINREVQKRGRINRTGQILKPIYDYVSSSIPAEKRLMMMLRKKLKSLDANTTSNQKQSENVLSVDDFLNAYGDRVVTEYLYENSDLNSKLGDPLGIDKDKTDNIKVVENAASKVSGRVAVLSTDEQEQFYNEMLERYNNYVELLKSQDKYDLEVEIVNLQAVTLESKVVVQGRKGASVFAESTYLEKCEVNNLKKPYTSDEVKALIAKSLGDNNAKDMQNEMIEAARAYLISEVNKDTEELNKKYERLEQQIFEEKGYVKATNKEAYLENRKIELQDAKKEAIELMRNRANSKFNAVHQYLRFFYVGKGLNYPVYSDENVKGICVGIVIDKNKPNPYAPSAIKIRIAIANSLRLLELPLSGESGKVLLQIIGSSSYMREWADREILNEWDEISKKSSAARKNAFIVTGNILQGFKKFESVKLISFTTADGSERKGMLLPDNYDPVSKQTQSYVTVPIIAAQNYILNHMGVDSSVTDTSGKIVLNNFGGRNNNDYYLLVPKNKNFHYIVQDPKIIKLCNDPYEGFRSTSDKMQAFFAKDAMPDLIKHLEEKHQLAIVLSRNIYNTYVTTTSNNVGNKPDIIRKAESLFERDKKEFDNRKNAVNLNKDAEKAKRIRIAKARAIAELELLKLV